MAGAFPLSMALSNAPASAGISLFGDLDALERDAGDALDRAHQPLLYDRIEWLRLIRSHVQPDAPLHLIRVEREGQRCWLYLMAGKDRQGEGLACWYTLAFAPVFDCAPEWRSVLLQDIALALRLRFARLRLAPMTAAHSALLVSALSAKGWLATAGDTTANWVAHTRDVDFETYWANRPSRLRNTVKRKARGSNLTIEIRDRFDDGGWDAYEAVYRASWKPEEGSPAFLRALAKSEGDAGTLRLGLAFRDGTPVACQFWTVENSVAIIHKLAHLETERANSPGTVLSEAMFRHVINRDRPVLIDFGTGDDGYKADWMDERRMMQSVIAYNPRTWSGLAGAARSVGAKYLKRVAHA